MSTRAMKLALDALVESQSYNDTAEFHDRKNKAITALRQAIAQPAQESINCGDCVYHYKDDDQKPCVTCIHGAKVYDNFEPRIPAAKQHATNSPSKPPTRPVVPQAGKVNP